MGGELIRNLKFHRYICWILTLSLLNQSTSADPFFVQCIYCAVFGELRQLSWYSNWSAGWRMIPNKGQNSYSNCINIQNVVFEDTCHAVSARQFLAFKDTFCHIYRSSRTNIILHLHISSCLQRFSTLHQSTPDTHKQSNTRRFLPSTHQSNVELLEL